MRKNVVILMAITGILLLCGCNRQMECYKNMVYNSQTEDCECKQGMVYNEEAKRCDCFNRDKSEIPELSSNTYNSVRALRMNFDFNVMSYADYPYYNHQGDTLKVYGWFWESDDESLDTVLFGDTKPWLGVDCPKLTLLNIWDFAGFYDKTDTCFLTGILEFPNHLGKNASNEHTEECFLMDDYVLRVVEIHN
ncbi:MAG: hypothetical protein IKZ54_09095 [Bacteroidales bacterium]|nr:hypothetical protein [Bacteroidales bacterium]